MNYNLQFYYDLLVEYYNEHQDINVPINYKVTTKDGRVVNLGCYINAQRNKYRNNKLTDEEIKMSQAIINKMMDNYKNDNSYRFTLENAQKEETKLEEGEK